MKFLFILLFAMPTNADEGYTLVNSYKNSYSQGLGLSGVGTNYSSENMLLNPSTMVFGKWWAQFNIGYNSQNNYSADLNTDNKTDTLNTKYLNFFGAIKINKWASGANTGTKSIYDQEFKDQNGSFEEQRKFTIILDNVSLPFAYKINEQCSVGLLLSSYKLIQRYQRLSNNPSIPQKDFLVENFEFGLSIGGTYIPEHKQWGMGMAYNPETIFESVGNINNQVQVNGDTATPFKTVHMPWKIFWGGFLNLSNSLVLHDQLEITGNKNGTEIPASQLTPDYKQIKMKDQVTFKYGLGLEYKAWKNKNWNLNLLSGLYHRPSMWTKDTGNTHFTSGLQIIFKNVAFSTSFDTTGFGGSTGDSGGGSIRGQNNFAAQIGYSASELF